MQPAVATKILLSPALVPPTVSQLSVLEEDESFFLAGAAKCKWDPT